MTSATSLRKHFYYQQRASQSFGVFAYLKSTTTVSGFVCCKVWFHKLFLIIKIGGSNCSTPPLWEIIIIERHCLPSSPLKKSAVAEGVAITTKEAILKLSFIDFCPLKYDHHVLSDYSPHHFSVIQTFIASTTRLKQRAVKNEGANVA